MRGIIGAAAVPLLALTLTASTPATPQAQAISRPVIFIVPHQDDELLSMGSAIQRHIAAGRDVYVVQVGDGTKSVVRQALCPTYGLCPEMTEPEFGHARDLENQASLLDLGVKPDHIFREELPEGSLELYAGQVIDKYIAKFGPYASYATMSWLDMHKDHRALGNVLNNRYRNGKIHDARFYQFQRYWNNVPTPKYGYYSPTSYSGIKRAAQEYYYVNQPIDRYGIGSKSVGGDFRALLAYPASKWHAPNDQWLSTADRDAAIAWVKKCYVTPWPISCYSP